MKSIYEEDTRIWCLVGIMVLNTCLYVDEKQHFADFKLALPRILTTKKLPVEVLGDQNTVYYMLQYTDKVKVN